MSLPYIPGWGDTLKEALPSIGKNIQESFLPHLSRQRELMRMLTEDPEKINAFIEMERTNPGSTSGLFGKGTGEKLAARDFTPLYKAEKSQKEANVKYTEGGIKRQEQDLKLGNLNLKEATKYSDLFDALPEGTIRDMFFKKNVGMTDEQYKLFQDDLGKVKANRAIADQYKNMNPKNFLDALYEGTGKYDTQTIQAIIENNESGMKYALSLYGDKKADALRRELFKDEKLKEDRYFKQLTLREAIDGAAKLGVSVNDYAKATYGFDIEGLPPSSADAVIRVTAAQDLIKDRTVRDETRKISTQMRQLLGQTSISDITLSANRNQISELFQQLAEIKGFATKEFPTYRGGEWYIGGKKVKEDELESWIQRISTGVDEVNTPFGKTVKP
jgi:hypothetical protein